MEGSQQQPGQAAPGWYPNPQGSGRRYWDGRQWTDQYQPAPGQAMPPPKKERNQLSTFYRKHPVWSWVIGVFVALLVIGALIPSSDENDTEQQPAQEPTGAGQGEAVQEPRASPQQRAREALGDSVTSDVAVGESEVRSAKVVGRMLNVTLSTPEGGFDGASTDDTDGLASAAFAKAYEDGGWNGPTYMEFRGGLVDSATGSDLPNAKTVSYRMDRRAAKQIDWSDDEALFSIDWGIYRLFCHPAIKGC